MSLKHAILGFLSFGPLSGYELKKAFDNSVSHFWPANQSQIYRTLAQMTKEGLLEKEVIEREERLDVKIYKVNKAGREELHHWLTTPLPLNDSREPFLIQVYFGGLLSDEELLNLLRHDIDETEKQVSVLNEIYKNSIAKSGQADDPRAFFLSMLTLDYGLKAGQAMLEWLNSAVEQIESNNYEY